MATIEPGAWTAIKYTHAIFDDDQQQWISDAEVAEISYTAFTSKPKAKRVTARLLVRRVKDMNPDNRQRADHRLPLPRGVHQQPAGAAGSREGAPRPRDRGAGHRRPEERCLGPRSRFQGCP